MHWSVGALRVPVCRLPSWWSLPQPPLLLVDGPTLNTHANAEGRDDSAGGPVFHVRGLCVATVYR